MAELPDERIELYKTAFSYTGIDFFGPLVAKLSICTRKTQTRFKSYDADFVCLTTLAIHLDLVGDLSTANFFLALIRVMARRVNPKTIWTDNCTNFIGAERELSILLKDLNQTIIENSLIPSPWMGGSWESIVKLTKRSLKSALKDRPVYEESLRTLLLFINVDFTLISHPPSTLE